MSRYKSLSVHAGIRGIKKALAALAAGTTAAALPLTILGVGTVGALLFRLSSFSAHTMMPAVADVSSAAPEEAHDAAASEEAPPASSAVESQPSKSGGSGAAGQKNSASSDDKTASESEKKTASKSEKKTDSESEKKTASEKTSSTGRVKEKKIKDSGYNEGNVYVKDGNSNYDLDIGKLLKSKAKCKIKKNAGYQVLIIHTHTTESYAAKSSSTYSTKTSPRTTDKSESVVAVADEIEKKLSKAGIRTLHITTYHDYPEYKGAYDRARKTIKKYLKKYPSIEMVIDVHRDSMTQKDGTKIKPTVKIKGKKAAQVMIITGCDNEGDLKFSGWKKNAIMAVQLQKQMADSYEGLARPLYFAPYRYNMDLTPNSLLIEFGTDVNTLAEATYSGKLVGNCLVKVLERYVVN